MALARDWALVSGAPVTGATTTPALSGGFINSECGGGISSAKGCGSGWQALSSESNATMMGKRIGRDDIASALVRKANDSSDVIASGAKQSRAACEVLDCF